MSWRDRLGATEVAEVAAAARWALAVDGVAPLSGHVLEALGEQPVLLRAASPPGRPDVPVPIVGVAVAPPADPAELFVTPNHRRQGIGRELLRSALERSGAVWAHGDLPAARALAAQFALVPVRTLLQMRRPLDPEWAAQQLAAAPVPDGVAVRTFVPGRDEQQFLAVNARAFDWHPEQGRLDLAGLRAEMAQPWFDPAGFFLAVDRDDEVLGFHWTKLHAEFDPPVGEVYVLGVDPAGRGGGEPVRGLGAPLTAIGLAHLAGLGLREVMLYVEGDNDRALRLYRRLGFLTRTTDVVYALPDAATASRHMAAPSRH